MSAKYEPKRMTFPKFTGAMTHSEHLCRLQKHKMNTGHKMHISCSNLYVDKIVEKYHNV